MKKPSLVYIPLVLLLVLASAVLAVHYKNLFDNFSRAASQVVLPFTVDGKITAVKPEAESAGLKIGDRIVAVNGTKIENDRIYSEEIGKLRPEENAVFTVLRTVADNRTETAEITLAPKALERNFNFYSQMIAGFLLIYFLPTLCILLGFWVVFARPRDYLAWFLLFLLLGVSSIGFENYPNKSLIGFYRSVFFSTWALAMLLFGIYFPERWSLDRRFPWAKWVLIAPLGLQVIFTMLGLLETFFGVKTLQYLSFLTVPFKTIVMPLNLLAIGVFFAALGHKSGTLTNPDARRRIRLMVVGTSVAMLPSFLIILYRVVIGGSGSFFDLVPFWFAILALLAMPLFPLTMAYVIVVHRAMDVSVVIRQGLQYALATGGVRVIEVALVVITVLLLLFAIRNFSENITAQIAVIVGGVGLIVLFDATVARIRRWIDRRFFREAYNAELILSDLSEQVRTIIETKPLLETVSAKISESLHVPQVVLLLKNGNAFHPAHALGYETAPPVALHETDKTVEKLKKNETLVVYQDDAESWINEEISSGERENLRRLNSQLLLPVGSKNRLSGVISLSPKRSEEPYSPSDLRLLKSVAAQTALALENSRLTEAIVSEAAQRERFNREVEIACEVQERLFPQNLPSVKNLDYYGACRPALGVGGDYYDFLELPEGKFGIAIGDISGKGIGAALMMASLQASLRGQAIHFKDDLAALVKQINDLLYEASTSNRYATFFYAQYEPQTRRLDYVNAGHNPPFLIRKNGEVERLEEGGAVVGMLPSMLVNYKQGEIELQNGDLLVGFTDGISEAMNAREEEWGEEAMLAAVKAKFDLPAAEMLDYIVAEADRFADGARQHDDMTMIVVRAV